MAERKVLNKYYFPDFDPSALPKTTKPKVRHEEQSTAGTSLRLWTALLTDVVCCLSLRCVLSECASDRPIDVADVDSVSKLRRVHSQSQSARSQRVEEPRVIAVASAIADVRLLCCVLCVFRARSSTDARRKRKVRSTWVSKCGDSI